MDLLASYSSGDSGDESNASALPEDSVSAAKNVSAHPTTAPSESDDSDCSDDDAKAAKANASIKNGATNSRKKSVLPSVDDLFANSSGPSFLAAAKTEEPICYTKKRKVEDVAPTADPKTASSSAASISTPAPVIQKTKPTDEKAPPKERLNRKEKVKNQRLAGQSGIGEDFKTWRTDEEMSMRQQYD